MNVEITLRLHTEDDGVPRIRISDSDALALLMWAADVQEEDPIGLLLGLFGEALPKLIRDTFVSKRNKLMH